MTLVHYDEQHPNEGRTQKYRLTLLDHASGQPIADELCDSKDSEAIKKFLEKHLDPNKLIFVVTDIANGYPSLFKEFFGKNLIHQLCLLHLNRLIVKDFPKHTTMEQELTKYKLLNIFYNRDREINFIENIDKVFPKRDQGLTIGEYFLFGILARLTKPLTTNSIEEWYDDNQLIGYGLFCGSGTPHSSKLLE